MSSESSVAKGFGVTCGVILAVMFVVGGLATVAVIGCVGTAVVGTGAVAKVHEAQERVREKQAAEEAAKNAAQAQASEPAAEPESVPAETPGDPQTP